MKYLFKVKKQVKYGIVIILALGTVMLIGRTVQKALKQEQVTQEKVTYSYSNEEDVNYIVNLNSTKVYDEKSLGEDTYYLAKYIENIVITFKENFKANEETNISGHYKVEATLRGYTIEQEQKVSIWSKNYELVPETDLSKVAKTQEFEVPVTVDLKPYKDFLTELRDKDGINTSSELLINMTGEKVIQTPKGEVTLPILSTVTIPVDQSYFKISKATTQPQQENQKESTTVNMPMNISMFVVDGMLCVLCIGIVILAYFYIGVLEPVNQETKRRQRIFTEYGSRIIAINQIKKEDFSYFYKLLSIDDMIKLADEIERPIMYVKQEDNEMGNTLYISDDKTLYSYEIISHTTSTNHSSQGEMDDVINLEE